MNLREDIETREYAMLDSRAAKSADSEGRRIPEEKCIYRTDFQRDRDRIVHSKSFRRLMHKTQVFLSPEEDHYRTRLTHTLEVAQVSRTIARILNYNEDLTEAIALGHDLGHTPFGHNGENILDDILKGSELGGFKHRVQSLRVADVIESTSKRQGLNLTEEVRDGILNHSGPELPKTLEGEIVRISDRIAYINHDIDDAIRSGVISSSDLPKEYLAVLGTSHSERINNLISDLATASENKDHITLSDTFWDALDGLRNYMFENVYNSQAVLQAASDNNVDAVLRRMFSYYMNHEKEMPKLYRNIAQQEGTVVGVKDYISGMTDRFALSKYAELFGSDSKL